MGDPRSTSTRVPPCLYALSTRPTCSERHSKISTFTCFSHGTHRHSKALEERRLRADIKSNTSDRPETAIRRLGDDIKEAIDTLAAGVQAMVIGNISLLPTRKNPVRKVWRTGDCAQNDTPTSAEMVIRDMGGFVRSPAPDAVEFRDQTTYNSAAWVS